MCRSFRSRPLPTLWQDPMHLLHCIGEGLMAFILPRFEDA